MEGSFAPLSIIPHAVFTYPTDRARATTVRVGRKERKEGIDRLRLDKAIMY